MEKMFPPKVKPLSGQRNRTPKLTKNSFLDLGYPSKMVFTMSMVYTCGWEEEGNKFVLSVKFYVKRFQGCLLVSSSFSIA